ncbi:MAG: class I SAM-dependent methyltransferase [Naasia sp.]
MRIDEARELLSLEGLRLLDTIGPYGSGADVLRVSTRLRREGHAPALIAAVLSQARLRERAESKFGPFASRMLFTEAGLEQSTRLSVASLHAGRFRRLGAGTVADLGCGIGGDALALASVDLDVRAVERDEVTAAFAAYNLAPFDDVRVQTGDAESADLTGVDAVYLDPARRAPGHGARVRQAPADWSPSLDFAFGLGAQLPTGVKLSPGMDRELIPPGVEAQWVTVDGETIELLVWTGGLARAGVSRAAFVTGAAGTVEMTADGPSPDPISGPLGAFIHEPAGSVIRAELIGALAERLDATTVEPGIAYLTGDAPSPDPLAASFRIRDVLPFDERQLSRALRDRGIGVLEIKKRGLDIDPAVLRKRLSLRGPESAALVLTKHKGKRLAVLCDRIRPEADGGD